MIGFFSVYDIYSASSRDENVTQVLFNTGLPRGQKVLIMYPWSPFSPAVFIVKSHHKAQDQNSLNLQCIVEMMWGTACGLCVARLGHRWAQCVNDGGFDILLTTFSLSESYTLKFYWEKVPTL